MTAKDAIEMLDGLARALRDEGYNYDDVIGVSVSALEKQNPKRLKETTSTKRCPSCNKQITSKGCIHGNYRYCRWCGQAIDWSNEE